MSTPEPDHPLQLPPSAEVRDELVVLRQRHGATMGKIKERCPVLMSLPATSHELARRQLDQTDRYVAAYEMLKCAVNSLIPRTDLARIASRTLNMDGEDSTLDQRRGQLQLQLFISEKSYRRLEEEAFTHLSGALVATDRSPCSGLPAEHFGDIEFDLHITSSAVQLVQVLNLLTFERRLTVREELSRLLLAPLPGARAALDSDVLGQVEGPWGLARHLIGSVILKEWPPRSATPTSDLSMFAASSLSDLFLSNPIDVDDMHSRVAVEEQQRFQQLTLVIDDDPTAEFWQLKGFNLLQFGVQIERIELDERWPEVLAGLDVDAGVVSRG